MTRTPAKKGPGTAVVSWEDEMAQQAAAAAAMEESTAGGQFFNIRGGILQFAGSPITNNEIHCIILGSVLTNIYYEGAYDPDNVQSPKCYAYATDAQELAPHEKVVEAGNQQNDTCKGCEKNEFGSADTGKGKACQNTRRLALLPVGQIHPKTRELELYDTETILKGTAGFMKLPVTSVKGYSNYVVSTFQTAKRAPHGVITLVKVVPDATSQFKVVFEPYDKVPNELMPGIMAKHRETMEAIMFPFPDYEEAPPPPARGRGKPAPAKAAPRGRR